MSISSSEWLITPQRPQQTLDHLLQRPDAAKLVRATLAQPLFLFIKTLGLGDAGDLLALCSTEQVQSFLDMDAWEGDRIAPERVFPWLAALCDLGVQKLAAHVRRLDGEFWTSFLGPRLRIYELTDEEPPEESEGLFYATPDRFYLIDILPSPNAGGDGDDQLLIRRFFDNLYRADLELARSIVQSARWDVGSETEELAQRFRSGRMADLGYIDYYEALKVYMLLDPLAPPLPKEGSERAAPDALRIEQGSQSLMFLAGLDDSESTFARAAAYLPEAERATLFQHLLLLTNRAMSADRVELGDAQAARAVLRRSIGYLSLGLEFRLLPGGVRADSGQIPQVQVNVAQAAQALQENSLLYLFRLGHSLTVQLRKLATLLVANQEHHLTTLNLKEDPASLLPRYLAEPLRNLFLTRPLYSGYLDAAAVVAKPTRLEEIPAPRPFMSLRDLGRATVLFGELSTLSKFLTFGLGLRREKLAETLQSTVPNQNEVQLGDLLGTMIANLLLQRPPVFVPLKRQDLPELRRAAFADSTVATTALPKAVRDRIREAIKARLDERAINEEEAAALWAPISQRLLDETLTSLGLSLGSLSADVSLATADLIPRLNGLVLF